MFKNYQPNKNISYILFSIPITLFFLIDINKETDIWFLFSHGKYVLSNGFPHTEILSMHTDFHFVMQQWLSSVVFYLIYHVFGKVGIYIFFIGMCFLVLFLLYKLCMIISKGKVYSSVLISSITTTLLSISLLVIRPQLLSFIIFILLFIVMEKYHKSKSNIIYFLPLLSLLLINLHASLWIMFFVFLLPYLVEYLYLFIKNKDNYLKKFIISLVLSLVVGFINPYGIEAMTYLLYSYGNTAINESIIEMGSFSIVSDSTVALFNSWLILIIFFFICTIMFIKKKDISIHQVLLLFGTFTLALMHFRNIGFYVIFSLPFLVKYISVKDGKDNYCPKYLYIILLTIISCIIIYNVINKYYVLKSDDQPIVNYLNKTTKSKDLTIYTDFSNGSIYEYNGYKAYIDSRAEVFLKSFNKKKDVYVESLDIVSGKRNLDSFINEYKFDYMVIKDESYIYSLIKNRNDYEEVFHTKEKHLLKRKR